MYYSKQRPVMYASSFFKNFFYLFLKNKSNIYEKYCLPL